MRTPVVIPAGDVQQAFGALVELALMPFLNRFGGTLLHTAFALFLLVLAACSAHADWGVFRYIVSIFLVMMACGAGYNALMGWLMLGNPSIAAFWSAVVASLLFRPLASLGWMGHGTLSLVTAWVLIWVLIFVVLLTLKEYRKALLTLQVALALALMPGVLTFALVAGRTTFSDFGWTDPPEVTCAGDPWLLCYGVPQDQLVAWTRRKVTSR